MFNKNGRRSPPLSPTLNRPTPPASLLPIPEPQANEELISWGSPVRNPYTDTKNLKKSKFDLPPKNQMKKKIIDKYGTVRESNSYIPLKNKISKGNPLLKPHLFDSIFLTISKNREAGEVEYERGHGTQNFTYDSVESLKDFRKHYVVDFNINLLQNPPLPIENVVHHPYPASNKHINGETGEYEEPVDPDSDSD